MKKFVISSLVIIAILFTFIFLTGCTSPPAKSISSVEKQYAKERGNLDARYNASVTAAIGRVTLADGTNKVTLTPAKLPIAPSVIAKAIATGTNTVLACNGVIYGIHTNITGTTLAIIRPVAATTNTSPPIAYMNVALPEDSAAFEANPSGNLSPKATPPPLVQTKTPPKKGFWFAWLEGLFVFLGIWAAITYILDLLKIETFFAKVKAIALKCWVWIKEKIFKIQVETDAEFLNVDIPPSYAETAPGKVATVATKPASNLIPPAPAVPTVPVPAKNV